MSSSSPEFRPDLTVVVGSNGARGAVAACLEALEPQCREIEVLVCEPAASPPELQRRFPFARFLERPDALVPALWSQGIAASNGRTVALTISPMRPAPDWVERVRSLRERHEVIAGAIEPDASTRLRDFAEYLCRYGHDMLPFTAHDCPVLPGDNAAYARELLDETLELHRGGFWEPVVNRRLRERGITLWHAPELVVHQGRSAGARAFLRQRLAHGRAYGAERGAGFSTSRNAIGVAAAPAVALLMTVRALKASLARRRLRLRALAALPLVLLFNSAWAVGEAAGHLASLRSGRS
jgi:hypothetical protein